VKRYSCSLEWERDSDDPITFTESPDGEWVRADDAEQAIGTALEFNVAQLQYVTEALYARERELAKLRAVVDALPRCDVCGKPATHGGYEPNDYDCDEHAGSHCLDLPYADALRGFESK
jgi:hypothetical protein